MSRFLPATLFALAILAVPMASGTARAWDFIYVDQMNVTLSHPRGSITLVELGWGLLVNTGNTNIEATELFATYEVVSTNPDFTLNAGLNNLNPIAPVVPNEAIGSIVAENTVLLGELEPDETHRNTPYQVFYFQVDRQGPSNGPVDFYVAMVMGEERANFIVHANFSTAGSYWENAIEFTHAARVSSVMLPTPVAQTTWGKIKAMYR